MDVRHRERGYRRVPVVEAYEPRGHLGIVKTGEPIAITGVAPLLRDTWRGLARGAVVPGQLLRRQQVEHCLTSRAAERPLATRDSRCIARETTVQANPACLVNRR